jgi:hypothetical protein
MPPASKYQPSFTIDARRIMGEGKCEYDVAQALEVHPDTFSQWKKDHEPLRLAIEAGRQDSYNRAERALFERAIGYSHPEEKLLVVSNGQGQGSSVERHKTTQHYPPDPTALKYYLGNKRPDQWKDRHEVNSRITIDQALKTGDLSELSEAELEIIANMPDDALLPPPPPAPKKAPKGKAP